MKDVNKLLFNCGLSMMLLGGILCLICPLILLLTSCSLCESVAVWSLAIILIGMIISMCTAQDNIELY